MTIPSRDEVREAIKIVDRYWIGKLHPDKARCLSTLSILAQAYADGELVAKEKVEELETVLSAWHNIFGMTQLTHAQDRLQVAEEKVERLERAKPKEVGVEDIYDILINQLPVKEYLSIPSHKLKEIAKTIHKRMKEKK